MTDDMDRKAGRSVRVIDCDEVMRQVLDFLDGEVDVAADEEIHHHIEECRSCFSRVEFEKQLKHRVRTGGKDAAPEALQKRITDLMKDFGNDDRGKPDTDGD